MCAVHVTKVCKNYWSMLHCAIAENVKRRQLKLPFPDQILQCFLSLNALGCNLQAFSLRTSNRIRPVISILDSVTPMDADIFIFSLVTGPFESSSGVEGCLLGSEVA